MANAASSFNSANDISKSFVGSGFIIDPSGLIVTNYHVVEGAYEISVTLSDGTVLPGKLVHASRVADLAVVQVQVDHPLTPVQWGDSTKIRVGDQVFAIGNPLGIGMSVSGGIVSGLNRDVAGFAVRRLHSNRRGNQSRQLRRSAVRHGRPRHRYEHRSGLADRGLGRSRPRHSVRQRAVRRRPADEIWLGPPGMDGREGAAGHAGDGRGDGTARPRVRSSRGSCPTVPPTSLASRSAM